MHKSNLEEKNIREIYKNEKNKKYNNFVSSNNNNRNFFDKNEGVARLFDRIVAKFPIWKVEPEITLYLENRHIGAGDAEILFCSMFWGYHNLTVTFDFFSVVKHKNTVIASDSNIIIRCCSRMFYGEIVALNVDENKTNENTSKKYGAVLPSEKLFSVFLISSNFGNKDFNYICKKLITTISAAQELDQELNTTRYTSYA